MSQSQLTQKIFQNLNSLDIVAGKVVWTAVGWVGVGLLGLLQQSWLDTPDGEDDLYVDEVDDADDDDDGEG